MLCFVVINSVLLNLSCVWVMFLLVPSCFQNRKKGSGLTGQEKGQPLQSIANEHDQTQGSVYSDEFDAVPSSQDLESMSPDSKSHYWSLQNLRSDICNTVSNIRTQILPSKSFCFDAGNGCDIWAYLFTVCICFVSLLCCSHFVLSFVMMR